MSHVSVEKEVAYFDLHDADPHTRELAVYGAQLLMPDSLATRQSRVFDPKRISGFRLPMPAGDTTAQKVIDGINSVLESVPAA